MFGNLFKRSSGNKNYFEIFKIEMEKFTLDKIKELSDKVEKQDRTIKFATDSPTFRIKTKERDDRVSEPNQYGIIFYPWHTVIDTNLYLYINKEEYVITLKELENKSINEEDCKLRVCDNLAYFDVFICSEKEAVDTIYKFVIDYADGNYVVSNS